MEVFVCSRGAIERIAPHDVPHVIVSITSHERDVARLPIRPECRGVLRLTFLDVLEDAPDAFLPHHTELIWQLVDAHADANLPASRQSPVSSNHRNAARVPLP